MRISEGIRDIFSRFQNLNLLALLHDLRGARTARADWSSYNLLCPLAHGLTSGQQVREVNILTEIADLKRACGYAAECLGAEYEAIVRFVRVWDGRTLTNEILAGYLEEIWDERLKDAEAVQQIIQAGVLADGQAGATPVSCPQLQEV